MKASRAPIFLFLLALPLQSVSGQGTTAPKMTPEQRTAAQARLNQQAAVVSQQTLDGPKTLLKNAAIIMRDTINAAAATAALIHRAQATKSNGVELSQARHLVVQCAAVQRVSATTLANIASLNTPDPKGTKLLAIYRATLTDVGRMAGECDKTLAATLATKAPSSAKIADAVTLVTTATDKHGPALDDLMRAMEIPIRP